MDTVNVSDGSEAAMIGEREKRKNDEYLAGVAMAEAHSSSNRSWEAVMLSINGTPERLAALKAHRTATSEESSATARYLSIIIDNEQCKGEL